MEGIALCVLGIVVALFIYFKQRKTSVTQEQFEHFKKVILERTEERSEGAYLDGLPELRDSRKHKVLLEATDLMNKGQFNEANELFSGYIKNFRTTETEKGAIINFIGRCYQRLGSFDEAIRNFIEVQLIGRRISDHHLEGLGYFNIGFTYVKKGNLKEAHDNYLLASRHYAKSRSHQNLALTFSNLGVVFFRLGEIETAEKMYKKVLSLAKENQDIYTQAVNLQNLGSLYAEIGQQDKAQYHHKKSLELFHSLGHELDEARQLQMLGNAYLDSKPEIALEYFLKAKTIIEKTDSIEDKAANLTCFAEYHSHKGEFSRAEEYYREALPLVRRINHKFKLAVFTANFGIVYVQTNRFREASELFKESVSLFLSMNMNKQAVDSLIMLGRSYAHLESISSALKCFEDAKAMSETIDYTQGLARSLFYIGFTKLIKFRDPDGALKDLQTAKEHFSKLKVEVDEKQKTNEVIEAIMRG